jgi:membrane associated rhomboid family serine protease
LPESSSEIDVVGRARPWLSYVLAAVCALGFLLGQHHARGIRSAAETDRAEAEAYFREHPYLEVAALVTRGFGPGEIERLRYEFREERDSRGAPEIPGGVQRRLQERLDRLVDRALAKLDGLPSQKLGLRSSERETLHFFTHAFVHAGWLHAAGNLALLLAFGFFLEGAWRQALFAGFAATAIGVSAAGFLVGNPGLEAPLIGTSGLLAAMAGAFAFRFGRTRSENGYLPLLAITAIWLLAPIQFGHEWSIARELDPSGGAPGASLWSLGAGFGFGVAAAVLNHFLQLEATGISVREKQATRVNKAAVDRALQVRNAGRPEEAFTLLTNALRRAPDDHEAALALCDVAFDLQRPHAAIAAMTTAIREELRRGHSEAAVAHWLELERRGLELRAEPALMIRIALHLRDAGKSDSAVSALQGALAQGAEADQTVVASRVARAARDLDAGIAEDAAWRALGSVELEIEERQALEHLLGDLYRAGRMPSALRSMARREAAAPSAREEAPTEAQRIPEPEQWEDPELLLDDEESDPELPPRPKPIDLDLETRTLTVVAANPLEFESDALLIEAVGSQKRVPYQRIQAVSVAAVDGLGERTVILIDLIPNWTASEEPLRVIRLRSDRFDPRRLSGAEGNALDAVRAFVELLLERCGATPLPDLRSAKGLPFVAFADLASYHRGVLMADLEAGSAFEWSEDQES